MILPFYAVLENTGYIAGMGDGIVTINGVPKSRKLIVYDAVTEQYVQTAYSLDNGHYLIPNLDPSRRYLVLCRPIYGIDERGVKAKAWDNVTPTNDKTSAELTELWQQMTEKG